MCGLYSILDDHRVRTAAESSYSDLWITSQPLTNTIHGQFGMLKVHRLIYGKKPFDL
jgi:hypothetical protein